MSRDWADGIAESAAGVAVREGRDAWRGEDPCCGTGTCLSSIL